MTSHVFFFILGCSRVRNEDRLWPNRRSCNTSWEWTKIDSKDSGMEKLGATREWTGAKSMEMANVVKIFNKVTR